MISKYGNCMRLLKINNKLKIVLFLQIKAGRIFDTLWVLLIKLALVGYEMIIANSYPMCTCAQLTDQPPFPGGGERTSYNGPYREALSERVYVYERVGILLVVQSIWKGREICHFGWYKGRNELTDAFCGHEKVKKMFCFCDLFIF